MPLCFITQENWSLIALEENHGFLWQEECDYVLDVGLASFGSHGRGFYEKNFLTWYPCIMRPEPDALETSLYTAAQVRAFSATMARALVDMSLCYQFSAAERARGLSLRAAYVVSWVYSKGIVIELEFSDRSRSRITIPASHSFVSEVHDYVNIEYRSLSERLCCVLVFKKYHIPIGIWDAEPLSEPRFATCLEIVPRCISLVQPETSVFDRAEVVLQPGMFFSIEVRDSHTGSIFHRFASHTQTPRGSATTTHESAPSAQDPLDAERRLETPQVVDVIFHARISNVEKLLQQNEDKPITSFIKVEGVRSINGVKPDANGNINLYATGSIVLDMMYDLDNPKKKPSIRIRSFARPCISCADLDDILDRFSREIAIYNAAARKVRAAQHKYIDTVFYVRKMLSDLSATQHSGNPDLDNDFKNLLQQLL